MVRSNRNAGLADSGKLRMMYQYGWKGPMCNIRKPVSALLLLLAGCAASPLPVFHPRMHTVTGSDSMHSLIPPGSELFLIRLPPTAWRRGQTCVYWNAALSRRLPVCHMIQTLWPGQAVMQGVGNSRSDPGYMTLRNYVGTVELVIPPR